MEWGITKRTGAVAETRHIDIDSISDSWRNFTLVIISFAINLNAVDAANDRVIVMIEVGMNSEPGTPSPLQCRP